jgi:hypothetical protein
VRFEPQRVPTRLPCRKLIAARLERAAAVLSQESIAAAGTDCTWTWASRLSETMPMGKINRAGLGISFRSSVG